MYRYRYIIITVHWSYIKTCLILCRLPLCHQNSSHVLRHGLNKTFLSVLQLKCSYVVRLGLHVLDNPQMLNKLEIWGIWRCSSQHLDSCLVPQNILEEFLQLGRTVTLGYTVAMGCTGSAKMFRQVLHPHECQEPSFSSSTLPIASHCLCRTSLCVS